MSKKSREKQKTTKFHSLRELMQHVPQGEKQLKKILEERGYRIFPAVIQTNGISEILNELSGYTTEIQEFTKYEYSSASRERGSIPLDYQENLEPALLMRVDDWHQQISAQLSEEEKRTLSILGIASVGGFLKGSDRDSVAKQDDPFVLSLKPGVNAFIGDRGSGKSTILDLLSLIVNSLNADENTRVVPVERADFCSEGVFKVQDFCKEKSIDEYACFFHVEEQSCEKQLYVIYMNCIQHTWTLLKRVKDQWISCPPAFEGFFPDVLVFNQGRIQKIIQSQDRFIINQILEELNPDLQKARRNLYLHGENLVKDIIERGELRSYNFNHVREWCDEVGGKLERLRKLLQDAEKTGSDLNDVQSSAFNSLQKDITNSTNNRYVFNEYSPVEVIQKEFGAGLNFVYFGLLPQREKNIILSFDDEQINQKSLIQIVDFLEERLLILSEIIESTVEYYEWNNNIEFICEKVESFCDSRSRLIGDQEKYFVEIEQKTSFIQGQKISFSHNFDIELFSESLESFKIIKDYYNKISIRTINRIGDEGLPNRSLRKDIRTLGKYRVLVKKMIDKQRGIRNFFEREDCSLYKNFSFLNPPIDIKLKKGSDDRFFKQLSYGERTGIIITIYSMMTDSKMIIIDQPEDNLDNSAISTILLPTTKHNVTNRKIDTVFATHKSGLLLGLRDLSHNIFVMKAPRESGGLDHLGTLNDRRIIESVVNILEQGIDILDVKTELFSKYMYFEKTQNELDAVSNDIKEEMFHQIENFYASEGLGHDIKNIKVDFSQRVNDLQVEILKKISSGLNFRSELQYQTQQLFIPKVYFSDFFRYIKSYFSSALRAQSIRRHLTLSHKKTLQIVEDNVICSKQKISGDIQNLLLDFRDNLNSEQEKASKNLLEIINEYKKIMGKPDLEKVNLFELLKTLDLERDNNQVAYMYDELRGKRIWADQAHIKVALRNILKNSEDSIIKKQKDIKKDLDEDFRGEISIKLFGEDHQFLIVEISDNGCGMSRECLEKIYKESYTSKQSNAENHGKGCKIIARFLRKNGAEVFVMPEKNRYYRDKGVTYRHSGTVQSIKFTKPIEHISEQ